jgi:heme-degrading monooxygenase HmoA
MYIAMNRFQVLEGCEDEFETVWRTRDRHLKDVPGFRQFHLLKGPARDGHTLYASHTVWENHDAFLGWTRSEAFRAAHARAGSNKPLTIGHPQFEGFEAVLAD